MSQENEVTYYSLKEIAEHSSAESLWLLINNGVYDVTSFMDSHPGGEGPLLEQAGLDATEAFEDIGHSSEAKEQMKELKIGELRPEDRKGAKDGHNTSKKGTSSCFWAGLMIPMGVAITAFVMYKFYSHYKK